MSDSDLEHVNSTLKQTGIVFRVDSVLDKVNISENKISYLCSVKNTLEFTPEVYYPGPEKFYDCTKQNELIEIECKNLIRLPKYLHLSLIHI